METMEPISAFVQIVGLLANYVASRGQTKSSRDADELKEFLAWLSTSGHGEIVALIDRNQATSISVKAALNEGHAAIISRLAELEKILATSAASSRLGDIALAVAPKARLSEQQVSILTAFEVCEAGKGLLHHTLEGASLFFLDGSGNSGYQPDEPRFFEADLDELVALELLSMSFNAKREKVFQFTRPGHELAKRLVKEQQKQDG